MSVPSFLQIEYEACFEQLRFYDTRQEQLLKYLATLTSAVATAQFALLKFLGKPDVTFYGAQGFSSFIVFVASVLLFLMMLQNRLYYVYAARQINAIRKHLLQTDAPAFTDNQMYTSTTFSALKWLSVHTMQLCGAALISSLFAGATSYAILHLLDTSCVISVSVLVCLAVGLLEAVSGALYLKRASLKSADKAIHREQS
jgi:hypothetical protein